MIVRRRLCLVLTLSLAGLGPAGLAAKEVDSFTHRHEILALPAGEIDGRPVTDFTPELDRLVNRIAGDVLSRLNEQDRRAGRSCRAPRARRRLFRKLSNALGGPTILTRNRLRPAINRHPKHFKIRFRRSVYRDFPLSKSPTMAAVSRVRDILAEAFRFDLVEPGAAGRVTPILVSSDKISHFFNRSQTLFEMLGDRRESDIAAVLAYNQGLEDSIWGTKATGVASWADLVANFQGMRFWIHLLGVNLEGRPVADPLESEGLGPYVRCSAEGWVQERPIALGRYLDPAWDEGLNCSDFRAPVLVEAVRRRIGQLERDDPFGRRYRCPVDPELIRRTAGRYGPWADRLINSEGPRVYRPAR